MAYAQSLDELPSNLADFVRSKAKELASSPGSMNEDWLIKHQLRKFTIEDLSAQYKEEQVERLIDKANQALGEQMHFASGDPQCPDCGGKVKFTDEQKDRVELEERREMVELHKSSYADLSAMHGPEVTERDHQAILAKYNDLREKIENERKKGKDRGISL